MYGHQGDAAALVALVEQGADCSAKDNAGWTPLVSECLSNIRFVLCCIVGALIRIVRYALC